MSKLELAVVHCRGQLNALCTGLVCIQHNSESVRPCITRIEDWLRSSTWKVSDLVYLVDIYIVQESEEDPIVNCWMGVTVTEAEKTTKATAIVIREETAKNPFKPKIAPIFLIFITLLLIQILNPKSIISC
ncbi:MAG: hypothetical protein ACXAB4_05165 [Candidatus Hodarchaeales archaeon]|jgi:hypothetical protein